MATTAAVDSKPILQSATRGGLGSPYQAAVVHGFNELLAVAQPGPGAGLVRVEACRTRIHAAHGDWPVKPVEPFIPGHEGVGIVFERQSAALADHVDGGNRGGLS